MGYKAKVIFKEGMKELIAWGEKEEVVDKFEEVHEELLRKGLVEE